METFIFILVISTLLLTFVFDMWLSILNYQNRNAEIPDEVKDVYNHDEYKKWLSYNMENNRIAFISKPLNFLLFVLFLMFGLFPLFNNIAVNLTESVHYQTLIFLGIFYIIDFIIGIFFSYYSKFHIEEKYGFNKSTVKTFVVDKIKSFILTIILGGGLILLLTTLFYNAGDMFYLYSWISILSILIFINMFYVKLFVPLFNKLQPLEDGELKNKIMLFAKKVGYEITKVNVMDASRRTSKLNAFFSGFGKFKQIVLFDTLCEKMNDEQIISVLAHEIGHSKHKHILKNIFILMINISIYLFLLLFALKSSALSMAFGFNEANFGFGIIIFVILISPLSIMIGAILNRISRKFEYQADYFTAVNGYKNDLEDSLKILARENFANLTPHPLFVAIKYSHPPIAFRIRAIRNIEDKIQTK